MLQLWSTSALTKQTLGGDDDDHSTDDNGEAMDVVA